MSLINQTIKIIVSEPTRLTKENLFGRITSDRGGDQLTVKLTTTIKGDKLSGDIVQLSPINEKERVVVLENYYSLNITGTLLTSLGNEVVFSGSVALD